MRIAHNAAGADGDDGPRVLRPRRHSLSKRTLQQLFLVSGHVQSSSLLQQPAQASGSLLPKHADAFGMFRRVNQKSIPPAAAKAEMGG